MRTSSCRSVFLTQCANCSSELETFSNLYTAMWHRYLLCPRIPSWRSQARCDQEDPQDPQHHRRSKSGCTLGAQPRTEQPFRQAPSSARPGRRCFSPPNALPLPRFRRPSVRFSQDTPLVISKHLCTIARVVIADHGAFGQLAALAGTKLGGDADAVLGLIVQQLIDKVASGRGSLFNLLVARVLLTGREVASLSTIIWP
jgi:hypothetical protein